MRRQAPCEEKERSIEKCRSEENCDNWRSVSAIVETPCCNSKEKVKLKIPEPMQIFFFAYQTCEKNYQGSWQIPFDGKGTSSHPCHFCKGVFRIPECGDGIYQINIAVTARTSDANICLVVSDETNLFENVITTFNLNDYIHRDVISVSYPLKEGYTVQVLGDGEAHILGGNKTYMNLTRV